MQVADLEMVRAVRREMARHNIDTSEASVSAMHGVVHLNGRVRPIRGHEAEFMEELHTLHRCLRQRPGIRDVIMEWTADGYNLGDMSSVRSRT
jgi:hypothetical protein